MLTEFDHSAISVNDLNLTEHFYTQVLGPVLGGATVSERSPGTIEDVIRRFKTLMEGRASRSTEMVYSGATPHYTLRLGQAVIPVRLNQVHLQEPPPEQQRGVPRHAFHVTPEQLDQAEGLLRKFRVPFEGPVGHPPGCVIARSLYFKDPSSNFLELCSPRSQG